MMNEDPKTHSDASAPETAILVEGTDFDRHEPKSGAIAIVSASVIAVLVVFIVCIYWLYTVAYEQVEFEQYSGVSSAELQAVHDREDEQLHRYSYINKEQGVVRMPIDRAIEIVAAEFQDGGKVAYNTKSYAVKVELPGGAAGGANPPVAAPVAGAPGATPSATPAAPPAAPAAPAKAGH
ncbi:MAG TPA: hypothetical protein VGK29_28175 [Paludibaculum sp.]|jgi:hypothetical protein